MNRKGFTLIEVIFSIAALGIICAVLLKLFVLAGDTNKRAGDIQDAQVAVTSVVETLVGSDSMTEGLTILGIKPSDGSAAGQYTLVHDTYVVVLNISREPGDYPGTLYALSVKAEQNGKVLADIETAKYDGGQSYD